ncbi:MBL fold metallo-hydrolase [Algoriphagus litoralis]|uniref:MBL fold metallo-hydrolase n=1 Tax=Algoriphagus litoralis TaxID=2202829 RepID=UPI000DB97B7E|nr:MBL fold metallo-hydrolase [Algoriphagus litoralis]
MKVKVWGCRGSLPAPGPENKIYGGNTSCIQVMHGEACIILDGGSGILRLGKYLSPEITEVHVLLSHLHMDHTMGLGFFAPLYNPKITVHLYGPSTSNEPLVNRLRRYFSPPLFPVRLSELPRHPIIHELNTSEFKIGDVTVKSDYICHPGPTLGYRLTANKSVLAYLPDHELQMGSVNFPNDPEWTSGFEIANGADLLLHDAAYTSKEYVSKIGWGHSSIRDAIAFGKMCKVKKLALFHHEPIRSDEQLDQMLLDSTQNLKLNFEVEICAEGKTYDLG